VPKDREAELRILVQNMSLRCIVPEMAGDEGRIPQHVFDQSADAPAPRRAGILREGAMTRCCKSLEVVAHARSL
jgi:hypothetical protein